MNMFGAFPKKMKPINWRRLLAAIVGATCTYAVSEMGVPAEVASGVCGALCAVIVPPKKKPEPPPTPAPE
jgi:hypothetical protein